LPKYTFFNGIKDFYKSLNVKKILNEIYLKNVTSEMADYFSK